MNPLPFTRRALACALLAVAASPTLTQAQTSAPLAEATSQQFIDLFTRDTGLVSRSFTRGHVPDAASSHCRPARGKEAESGATARTLEVEYVGDSAPGVQLDIGFSLGSDKLNAREMRLLDNLAQALRDPKLSEVRFAVAGHTDVTGDARVNLELSCARAMAAMKYLSGRGIAPQRMAAYGFGSKRLLPGFDAQAPQHRRVEVRLDR